MEGVSGQASAAGVGTAGTLIGVCGGSGSGKTTLARRLVESLGPEWATCISFDAYYREYAHLTVEERSTINFDHPQSLDVGLLIEHLRSLRAGREVTVPVYDFTNHRRSADLDLVAPRRFIIIEGILLFAFDEIRAELDHLIFRRCDEETRAERRFRRDVAERGRTPASVRRQWAETVKPMHDVYVEPFAHHADLVTTPDQDLEAVVAHISAALTRGRPLVAPA